MAETKQVEPTDKERVLARWPKARIMRHWDGAFVCYVDAEDKFLSDWQWTEAEAWSAAARRIEEQNG